VTHAENQRRRHDSGSTSLASPMRRRPRARRIIRTTKRTPTSTARAHGTAGRVHGRSRGSNRASQKPRPECARTTWPEELNRSSRHNHIAHQRRPATCGPSSFPGPGIGVYVPLATRSKK
jgi:hypothetical protein